MSAWKAVCVVVLTLVAFFISAEIFPDKPRPVLVVSRTGTIVMTHTAEAVHLGSGGSPLFSVRVEGVISPDSVIVCLRYSPEAVQEADLSDAFIRLEMTLADQAIDDYEAYLSNYPPGTRMLYYIEVTDVRGDFLARLPEAGSATGGVLPFEFRAIPPAWIVIVHRLLMLSALFAAGLAFLTSVGPRFAPGALRVLGKSVLWAAIFLLAGGVVIEISYTKFLFEGIRWGGWPIGRFDFRHTLIQFVLLFWIVLTVLLKGSAFTVKGSGNLVSATAARILASVGYVLTLAIYLVPR